MAKTFEKSLRFVMTYVATYLDDICQGQGHRKIP